MAKNREKVERNKIREKYARDYAHKLRTRDKLIQGLCLERDELKAEIKRLNERLSLERMTVDRLDELVETLQKWTELSDSELAMLKSKLAREHESAKAVGEFTALTNSMLKFMGSMY